MRYFILLLLFAAQLQAGETIYLSPRRVSEPTPVITQSNLPAEAQSTPHEEVHRILKWFNLKPEETLVEYGCGYDARFCISASAVYGCRSIGIEIDHERAEAAKRLVRLLGLQDKVTIIEGDATKLDIEADYGVAYLWPETLVQLRQKIIELRAFASYSHDVPGMSLTKNGDSYLWGRNFSSNSIQFEDKIIDPVGYWNGVAYHGRVCNNPRCEMCNSIQQQIDSKGAAKPKEEQPTTYSDETYKVQCTKKYCVYETWRTFSDGGKKMLRRWRVNN